MTTKTTTTTTKTTTTTTKTTHNHKVDDRERARRPAKVKESLQEKTDLQHADFVDGVVTAREEAVHGSPAARTGVWTGEAIENYAASGY
jgi:hypothetical protein